MITFFRLGEGPIWSEAIIVFLALAGLISVKTNKGRLGANQHLLLFVALYTIVMTTVHALIPYKTPWCMLGFLHGMILLAGVGAVAIIKLGPNFLTRSALSLLLLAAGVHLVFQTYLANYKYFADPVNPYVYAHTSTDIFDITERIEQVAQVHPEGFKMRIHVICPGNDYWPLPWYLRRFERIDWYNKVFETIPNPPVAIASPAVEQQLINKLYDFPPEGQKDLYVPLFDTTYTELRPKVELDGYVTKDLWDRYQQSRQETPVVNN